VKRLIVAVRALFRVLFDGAAAAEVERVLNGEPIALPAPAARVATLKAPPAKKKPTRSDALTLLAALQREARLVDFLQEPLDGYADAQIGAAVRDVHRDARAAIRRMFDLQPLTDKAEGETIEVAAGADAMRFRLTGNVAGSPPFRGTIRHHGWQAAKCELPEWTGGSEGQPVVAPIEVEVA
jgi:hypothetical protein